MPQPDLIKLTQNFNYVPLRISIDKNEYVKPIREDIEKLTKSDKNFFSLLPLLFAMNIIT